MWSLFKKIDKQPAEENIRCSFCTKHHSDVKKMIGGPDIFICDECINLCNELINEDWEIVEEPLEPERPPLISNGLSCALCRFPVAEGKFKIIHDRGPLCLACLEVIKGSHF